MYLFFFVYVGSGLHYKQIFL